MADEIKADYSQLEQIATRFENESNAVQQVLQKLKSSMDPLKNGGWIGKGSDAFFQEMEDTVLPATQRLHQALTEANQVTKKIVQTMRQAEEEAASPFRRQ